MKKIHVRFFPSDRNLTKCKVILYVLSDEEADQKSEQDSIRDMAIIDRDSIFVKDVQSLFGSTVMKRAKELAIKNKAEFIEIATGI